MRPVMAGLVVVLVVRLTGNGNGRGNGGQYLMTPVIGIVSVQ